MKQWYVLYVSLYSNLTNVITNHLDKWYTNILLTNVNMDCNMSFLDKETPKDLFSLSVMSQVNWVIAI